MKKVKFIAALFYIVFFLTGCGSMECQITRCGQKCQPSSCASPQCGNCNLCQIHPQDTFCNDGAGSYDTYRVVKPCVRGCSTGRIYKE